VIIVGHLAFDHDFTRGLKMRRPWTIAIASGGLVASLVALVMAAPAAAQGPTKYRYWQDLSVIGPFRGQISLAIAYEDRHGNGKLTPRYAAAYQLRVQVSCNPGGETDFGIGGNAYAKYAYFAPAITNGRFDHRFEDQFETHS
jgi:hypothetical protein